MWDQTLGELGDVGILHMCSLAWITCAVWLFSCCHASALLFCMARFYGCCAGMHGELFHHLILAPEQMVSCPGKKLKVSLVAFHPEVQGIWQVSVSLG